MGTLSKQRRREIKDAFRDYRGVRKLSNQQKGVLRKYNITIELNRGQGYLAFSNGRKTKIASEKGGGRVGRNIASQLIRILEGRE